MTKARDIADNAGQGGGSNLIINGAMEIAQRGVSFTGDEYTLDRFYQLKSGATATTTQETFALGSELEGFAKYLKQSVSTGNDYCGIIYKVEDVKSLPQGKATLSFYAKGTNPSAGSFQVVIYRMHDGSTIFDTLLDTTITLTSSWQRFTKTFDVGSLSGMSTPTANSLIYIAIRQSGSDAGTSAWELNLTGVQLETGDKATDFEHMSFADELQKCLRYYTKTYDIDVFVGHSGDDYDGSMAQRSIASTSSNQLGEPFSVRMRAMPTVTFYGPTPATNTAGKIRGSGNAAITATLGSNISERIVTVSFTSNQSNSYISAHYTADAEL